MNDLARPGSSGSPTRWLPSSGEVRGREGRAGPPRMSRWPPAPRRWPSGRRADEPSCPASAVSDDSADHGRHARCRPSCWSPCSTTTGRFRRHRLRVRRSVDRRSGCQRPGSSIRQRHLRSPSMGRDRCALPGRLGFHSGRRHEQDVRLPSPLIYRPAPGRGSGARHNPARGGAPKLSTDIKSPSRSTCWRQNAHRWRPRCADPTA